MKKSESMFHVKQLVLLLLALPLFGLGQHMGSTTLELKALPVQGMNDIAILSELDKHLETTHLNPTQKEWFYWTNYSRADPRRFWDSIVQPLLKEYPNLKNYNYW